MELKELIEWHLDNAKECQSDGEEMQRVFHFNAVALLSELELWQNTQKAKEIFSEETAQEIIKYLEGKK